MSLHQLQNREISVSVSETGAELKSLRWNASGREWMWQASPEFWPRTSPILFPVVGKLRDNQFSYRGLRFPLSQHGFARDMPFELTVSASDFLRFRLKANEQSLRHYPFHFCLDLEYRLLAGKLSIGYKVENQGKENMPFSIGAHPGFSLPSWPMKKYWLEFEQEENLLAIPLREGLISNGSKRIIPLKNRLLEISENLFLQDALVFSGLKSDWIGIRDEAGTEQLRLHFPGFPFMGIWSKPGAPFVCIEPWFGHADPEEFTREISEKPGILSIKPGDTFECAFTIEIISES